MVPETPASLHLSSLTRALALPSTSHLELRGLLVTGAALPTAPYPLPPASFLALSAIRLLPTSSGNASNSGNATSPGGPRLSLRDVVITTPSCVALSLHQDFACRASPSPNFTVTANSLLVHRFTTPTADLTNVTLRCSGPAVPFPCLAVSVSSGAQLLKAISELQDAIQSGLQQTFTPVPAFIHVATSFSLVPPAEGPGSSNGSSSPRALQPVEVVIPRLVIGGSSTNSSSNSTGNSSSSLPAAVLQPPNALPELDLAGSVGLLVLRAGAGVVLQDLVLRRPPLGPDSALPRSLLRLPLWTFDFNRNMLGWSKGALLQLVRGVVVKDMPRSELAMYLLDSATSDGATVAVAAAGLPTALKPWKLAWASGIFWDTRAEPVPGTPGDVWVDWFSAKSAIMTLSGVLLQPETWLCPGGSSNSHDGGNGSSSNATATTADAWAAAASPDTDCLRREPLWAVVPAGLSVSCTRAGSSSGGSNRECTSTTQLVIPLGNTHRELPILHGLQPRDLDWGPRSFTGYNGYILRSRIASLRVWPLPVRISAVSDYPGYEVIRNQAVLAGAPNAVRVLDLQQLISALRLPTAAALEGQVAAALAVGGPERAVAAVASVSLTVRSLVLANLPSSSGCRAGQQAGCEAQLARLAAAEATAASASSEDPGDRHRHRREALASADAGADSATQGMPPALANFTACLWSVEFDRLTAWQQLTAGGSSSISSSNSSSTAGSLRPAGLPYVFLESVVLLLPAAELQLLAALWSSPDRAAVSGAAAAVGAGFAEHLAAALTASSAPLPQPPGAPPSLAFERFVWCGLEGRNVTLTSAVDLAWGMSDVGGSSGSSSSLVLLPLDAALPAPLLQLLAPPPPPQPPRDVGGVPGLQPSATPGTAGPAPLGGPPGCAAAGACDTQGGGGGGGGGVPEGLAAVNDSRFSPVAAVAGAAAAGVALVLTLAGVVVWRRRRQPLPATTIALAPPSPRKGDPKHFCDLSTAGESALSGGSSEGVDAAAIGGTGTVGIILVTASSTSNSQPRAGLPPLSTSDVLTVGSCQSCANGAGGVRAAADLAGGWPPSVSVSGTAATDALAAATPESSSHPPMNLKPTRIVCAVSVAAAISNALSGSCSGIDLELVAAPASAGSLPEEKEAAGEVSSKGAWAAPPPAAGTDPTIRVSITPRAIADAVSAVAPASAGAGGNSNSASFSLRPPAASPAGRTALAAAAQDLGGGRGDGSGGTPGTPRSGAATSFQNAASRLRAVLWAAGGGGSDGMGSGIGMAWRAGGCAASRLALRFKDSGACSGSAGAPGAGDPPAQGPLSPRTASVAHRAASCADVPLLPPDCAPGPVVAPAGAAAAARARSAAVGRALQAPATGAAAHAATSGAQQRPASSTSIPRASAAKDRGVLARALAGIHRDMQAMQVAVAVGGSGTGSVVETADAAALRVSADSAGPASAGAAWDAHIVASSAAAAASSAPTVADVLVLPSAGPALDRPGRVETVSRPSSEGGSCKPAGGPESSSGTQPSNGPADVLATPSTPGVLESLDAGRGGPLTGVAITRELGRGAQGVVYAGTWRGLNVAVKSTLLHRSCHGATATAGSGATAGAGLDPGIAQAVQEAAISAAVSHPNVVATYTYSLQQLGAGMGASTGADGTYRVPASHTARRSSGTVPFESFLSSSSTDGSHGEAEAWKLTLVQELCDANSLRHCLATGRLVRARAVRVQQPQPPSGTRLAGSGTGVAAALEWAPLLIPIKRASSTSQQPNPKLGTETRAVSSPRCASALGSPHPFVVGSCGEGSANTSMTVIHSRNDGGSSSGAKPEGTGTRAERATAMADGGQSSSADSQQLQAPAPLSVEVMISVALQVARGLAHLHERSIVHADVSSANVLLQTTSSGASRGCMGQGARAVGGARAGTYLAAPGMLAGPGEVRALPHQAGAHSNLGGSALSEAGPSDPYTYGYVAKVCDFGLSGRLDADAGATHISGPARRSSAYSAPELVRCGRAGPASDVYALAVVLWELAWGAPLPALLVRPEGAGVREWLTRQDLVDPAAAQALPASLLPWPAHAPSGYVSLAGECLAAAPAGRPLMRVVCVRLQEMLMMMAQ